jgi:hypothetical protein
MNMSAQMIDHQDAVRNLMAERYLLGELSAGESEAYEEHLFSCDACFEQVKAGTEFVSHLRQMGGENPRPAQVPGFLARLMTRLRQPVTVAACALLACVSGLSLHQRGIIDGLRRAQVTPSIFPSDGAKAGGVKQITVPANTRFDVSIQVSQDGDFNSYEGQVLTESQHLKESFPISAEQTKETIHVQLDSGIEGPGTYFMVVNGLAPDGRRTEVNRYKFQVLLKE